RKTACTLKAGRAPCREIAHRRCAHRISAWLVTQRFGSPSSDVDAALVCERPVRIGLRSEGMSRHHLGVASKIVSIDEDWSRTIRLLDAGAHQTPAAALRRRNEPFFVMPLFCGLLPVRDEADIVGQCLQKALQWADAIYVLDTGSVDNTWEIVQDFAGNDKRVVPMRKEPVYFSETRLRSYMFHIARQQMRDGDWFLR